MNSPKRMCIAGMWSTTDHGCDNDAHPDSGLGLCFEHWKRANDEWITPVVTPPLRCPNCNKLTLYHFPSSDVHFCSDPECIRSGIRTTPTEPRKHDADEVRRRIDDRRRFHQEDMAKRTDVVYYLRFADRIKIGTTSNLYQRVRQIYHDECLAVEQGSFAREARRHEQFGKFIVAGQREWFHASPELVGHINDLRAKNGPPMAAVRRWAEERLSA